MTPGSKITPIKDAWAEKSGFIKKLINYLTLNGGLKYRNEIIVTISKRIRLGFLLRNTATLTSKHQKYKYMKTHSNLTVSPSVSEAAVALIGTGKVNTNTPTRAIGVTEGVNGSTRCVCV